MLLEMKVNPGGGNEGGKQMRDSFDRAKDLIGRTIVERPFLGNNMLTDQGNTLSKLTGQLFAPLDGEYTFAMAADDRGVLFIDGQQIVFAKGAPGDIRFNGKITLTRGGHEMIIYTLDKGSIARVLDPEVIVHESWRLASKKRSSTTREYLGAVLDLDALRQGRGEFETSDAFYKYWRAYPFKVGRSVSDQLNKILNPPPPKPPKKNRVKKAPLT